MPSGSRYGLQVWYSANFFSADVPTSSADTSGADFLSASMWKSPSPGCSATAASSMAAAAARMPSCRAFATLSDRPLNTLPQRIRSMATALRAFQVGPHVQGRGAGRTRPLVGAEKGLLHHLPARRGLHAAVDDKLLAIGVHGELVKVRGAGACGLGRGDAAGLPGLMAGHGLVRLADRAVHAALLHGVLPGGGRQAGHVLRCHAHHGGAAQ